jgi:DNA replicative helicase MCM subunit Mcm2 (Cdc46/Mcm family)
MGNNMKQNKAQLADNLQQVLNKLHEIEIILQHIKYVASFKNLCATDRDTIVKISGIITGNTEYLIDCLIPDMKKLLK